MRQLFPWHFASKLDLNFSILVVQLNLFFIDGFWSRPLQNFWFTIASGTLDALLYRF
jgi:hypothetical protein